MRKSFLLSILLVTSFTGFTGFSQAQKFPEQFSINYPFNISSDHIFLRLIYYKAHTGGQVPEAVYSEGQLVELRNNNSLRFSPLKGQWYSGSLAEVKQLLAQGQRFLVCVQYAKGISSSFYDAGTLDMSGAFFPGVIATERFPPEIREEIVSRQVDQMPDIRNIDMAPVPDMINQSADKTGYPRGDDFVYTDRFANDTTRLVTAKELAGKKPVVLPLSRTNWYGVHFSGSAEEYQTVFEDLYQENRYYRVNSGLKVHASDYRLGGFLLSRTAFNVSNKVVYMKWKLEAGYNFSDMHMVFYTGNTGDMTGAGFLENTKLLSYLTTRNQWDESVEIPYTNDWFYTRLVFTGKICTAYTSSGDYDNKGGKLVQKMTKLLPSTTGRIGLGFGDVYAGTQGWFILGEARVEGR